MDIKPCPFHGGNTCNCDLEMSYKLWSKRPLEDALQDTITQLQRTITDRDSEIGDLHNKLNDALDDFDRAKEELERYRWIPVGERLPDKNTTDIGEEYLVMLGYPFDRVAPMAYINGEWMTGSTHWNSRVTHWMPLPPAPDVTETETITEKGKEVE